MPAKSLSELLDLRQQTAIVTGGAKGIGEGIARRLAEAGAAVVIADMDEAGAQATAQDIERQGGRAMAFRADVSDASSVHAMVDAAISAYGRLDILVNNAGIFPFSPALELSEELWDRVLAVNLKGTFLCSQAAARRMVEQGPGGRIVNIASIDALHPTGNLVHYDASKAGVVMLTKALALELGPLGVRVNAIAPGGIQTPGAQAAMQRVLPAGVDPEELARGFLARIPLKRMGEPDDIALAVLFLATELSSYVTGALLVVDGGFLLS
jgi:2-deoxy-D-gluconate 3-dehydrogenase